MRTATDDERWDGTHGKRYISIREQIDWDVRQPLFNSLRVYGSTATAEPAEALMCAIAPHPKELDDSAYFGWRGGCRPHEVGPPETSLCSTVNELQRFGRRYYDQEHSSNIALNVGGEWTPIVDEAAGKRYLRPDAFVWLIGLSPYKVESLEIYAGDPVSYGAWRIESLIAELTTDEGVGNPYDRRYARRGVYSLSYVGPVAEEGFPMFTEGLPA